MHSEDSYFNDLPVLTNFVRAEFEDVVVGYRGRKPLTAKSLRLKMKNCKFTSSPRLLTSTLLRFQQHGTLGQ
jgi:hypothetical protein